MRSSSSAAAAEAALQQQNQQRAALESLISDRGVIDVFTPD